MTEEALDAAVEKLSDDPENPVPGFDSDAGSGDEAGNEDCKEEEEPVPPSDIDEAPSPSRPPKTPKKGTDKQQQQTERSPGDRSLLRLCCGAVRHGELPWPDLRKFLARPRTATISRSRWTVYLHCISSPVALFSWVKPYGPVAMLV